MESRLNPLNDALVKYIFFDEARKPLTLSLINSFFDAEGTPAIVDFSFRDREPDPDDLNSKHPRLDVLGVCSDGTVVEIEFQNDQYEAMADRVIFYWGRLAQKLSKGVPYKDLPRIVCINVLGYTMFTELSEYHNCFMVIHTRHAGYCLSPRFELHFAEVSKWEKNRPDILEMNQLSRWLMYFSKKTTAEELKELAMHDSMIAQALDAEKVFATNTELMSAYDWSEKDRLDRQANQTFWENRGREEGRIEGLNQGRIEGLNQGRIEGLNQGRIEGLNEGRKTERYNIVLSMLNNGLTVEQAALIANMSIDDVKKIEADR